MAAKLALVSNSPASQFQVDDGCTKASIGSAAGPNLNYGTSYLGFNAARNVENQSHWIVQGDGVNNGGGVIYTTIFGDIYFAPIGSTSANDQELTDLDVKQRIKLRISSDGVTHAKEILVETNNWPDYVFKPSYRLLPLNVLKSYIKKNEHLPEIPSVNDVSKDGINLGEMNKLLLKKVEELTLYLLQEKEKNDKSRQAQDAKIKELERRLTLIKTIKRK